jgi:hypothetical protein
MYVWAVARSIHRRIRGLVRRTSRISSMMPTQTTTSKLAPSSQASASIGCFPTSGAPMARRQSPTSSYSTFRRYAMAGRQTSKEQRSRPMTPRSVSTLSPAFSSARSPSTPHERAKRSKRSASRSSFTGIPTGRPSAPSSSMAYNPGCAARDGFRFPLRQFQVAGTATATATACSSRTPIAGFPQRQG